MEFKPSHNDLLLFLLILHILLQKSSKGLQLTIIIIQLYQAKEMGTVYAVCYQV